MNKLIWLSILSCALLPGGAKGQAATTLRLGYFPNITHAQALYAKATGAFEKATGARIEWMSFNGGPSAIEALFIDAVDATFIGPGPAINGYMKSRGAKFVVIAGAASGGAGLVVRQDSGIRTDGDFGGKVIATPQLGNTQDLAARVWFAAHHYRLKETGGTVSLVNLSNPDQLTMFRKRQIDGAWTIEPWLSRLEHEGGGRLFIDEKSLWPEGRYATTELVVTRRYLAAHEESVRQLLAAHVDITRRLNADKTAAAPILNEQLKKETGKALDPTVIQSALDRVEFTWDPIASSVRTLARRAHEIHFLRKAPELGGLFSLAQLNTVLRQKNLPEVADSDH